MATNTAASFTNHTGNGSTANFSISFSYLATTEIDVTVGGVLKTLGTHYTINGSTLTFTGGNIPSNGTAIKFQRDTDISAKKVDFQDGSVLTEADLDANSDQILFGLQEFVDIVNNDLFKIDGSNTITGSLQFEGSSVNDFETTLSVTNPTADRTITFPDITGTVITSADTGTINSTMIANGTIVDADINSSADINGSKLLNDSVGLAKLGSGALPTDITIASANIVNGTIVNEDIASGTLDGRYYTETELDAGQLDNRYFTETELTNGQLDNRYYTQSTAQTTFFRKGIDPVTSTNSWISQDNFIATTKAIDARIIDIVDDVGGFIPVTENTFPNDHPDPNEGTGTIISLTISAFGAALTSTSSGTNTSCRTADGTGIVTLNGLPASTNFAVGSGILLETTTTQNTYTFHRLVPKATEVTTVAGISTEIGTIHTNITNVNAVGTDISNVNTVANNINTISNVNNNLAVINNVENISTEITTLSNQSNQITQVYAIRSDVTTVANDATDIGAVAGKATEIGRLGTADAVADMAILGTTDVVADMNLLATSSNVTNINNVGGSIANVNTVAGSVSNVNTVATNISNINTASTYLNNFLQLYLGEASSDPTVDGLGNAITEGDLYFNSVSKHLRVFNGQVFQGIAENSVEVANFATAAFNALYTASAGSNSIDLGGLAVTGAVFANEAIAANRVSLVKGSGTFNLGGV